MIIQVDETYQYPTSLASTITEGALHQHFLRDHFSSLTDCDEKITPTKYFIDLVFNSLNNHKNV